MAGGIFISYRRDDTRQAAGRLADDLADAFGTQSIFRDIEAIELGVDFAEALNKALGACVVMLVLIGQRWLDIADTQGRRRLDDPRDWIRQEIAAALKRGVRVVPVLLDGTDLPAEDRLPDDLKPLVRRQALDLADARWKGDLARLVDTLARVPGLQRVAPTPAPPPPARSGGSGKAIAIGIAIGVVGLLVVAAMFAEDEPDPVAPAPAPAPQPFTPAPPAPTPSPAPAPANLPNLNGMWRSLSEETYQIVQNGSAVEMAVFAGGLQVGRGTGSFDGARLQLNVSMGAGGVHIGNLACDMAATPDFRAFGGQCNGPNGPFPMQFFR